MAASIALRRLAEIVDFCSGVEAVGMALRASLFALSTAALKTELISRIFVSRSRIAVINTSRSRLNCSSDAL